MAKKGLGRGLDASVFGGIDEEPQSENGVINVKLSLIEPNKDQPRKSFDKEKIETLAQSIKDHGVIQPLVVVKNGDRYSIVAGERRWRAAKAAGITEIPVVVKDYTPRELTEIALIENIQREDLNPIEEALGYRSLMDEFDLTQDTVAQRIGKSRSAVANTLRLLSLSSDLQKLVISGELSSGHARAVLSVNDESLHKEFAEKIIESGMSVREAENMAKRLNSTSGSDDKKEKEVSEFDIELQNVTQNLASHLGTKVRISDYGKRGKIEIEYYGNDDLERLLSIFGYYS